MRNRCTLSGPDRTYSPNGLWLCKGIARRHCSCQFFHHGRRCGVLPKFYFRPSVAPNPSSASNRLTPTAPTKSVKAFTSRITRNKIMHALNGNIIWFERRTPPPRNYLWRQSFYSPNGMCIFRFSFYSKDSLWLYAHRRGSSFEVETTRRESPTLYGIVCRAVASRGGGPGDRWQLVQSHKRMWREGLSDPTTYGTNHLRYEDRPSGYQHREAHGGTQRGMRSFASNQRRLQSWKDARREGRKDYRIWKSSIRDYILLPPTLKDSFTFAGSMFQQMVNSRHLPLSFHLRVPISQYRPLREYLRKNLKRCLNSLRQSKLTCWLSQETPPLLIPRLLVR